MPQGGHGKARKILDDMIIDSDDDAVVVATKEPATVGNLGDSDLELSNSLPAAVSKSTAPGQPEHGKKWKILALLVVPRKQISAERKPLFYFMSAPITLTVIAEDNSEHPKVTSHLKITSSSKLKKQLSKRTNMARILKVSNISHSRSFKIPSWK